MTTIFKFSRGGTIIIGLDVMSGDIGDVTDITARMRPLTGADNRPLKTAPISATMTVTDRAAAGDIPAGWDLSLAAVDCAALSLGRYYVDAVLTVGSALITTDGVEVHIVEPATVLA